MELIPPTILLSGFFTELIPHWINEGRYEVWVEAVIFFTAPIELDDGTVVGTLTVAGVVVISSSLFCDRLVVNLIPVVPF